ncbi:MAG: hypothetical protein CL840_17390 [Crocinitomicaceae bacterium]|nr:hypothetical protein [Crocinitomicaceae bacterium]
MKRIALTYVLTLIGFVGYCQQEFNSNLTNSIKLTEFNPKFTPSQLISPFSFKLLEDAVSLTSKNSDKPWVNTFFPISHTNTSIYYSERLTQMGNPYQSRFPQDAIITGGINYVVNKIASKSWSLWP